MKTLDHILLIVAVACVLAHFQGVGPIIPDITPEPAPIPAEGLNVLVVYETEDLTPQENAVLGSTLWQSYVLERGGDFEMFDADADRSTPPAKWRDALAKAAAGPLPVVVVSNGRTGETAPLPASAEQMVDLIGRYAQ